MDPELNKQRIERMRVSNAEWDFMARTFNVFSLAEMSLRQPALKQSYLPIIDEIIQETLQLERERGFHFFLMPYWQNAPYKVQPPKSLFVGSEIALMLGARRMLQENNDFAQEHRSRIRLIVNRLGAAGRNFVESYPDECWLFDHAAAIAALRIGDYLDGTDSSSYSRNWLRVAREKLTDRSTGLLCSSFTTDGRILDGPEGSSIYFAAHCLRLVDEVFAAEQYRLARKHLRRELLGFGWSREWPLTRRSDLDVDSGMVIPILDVSAGGSGMAFIAAASFRDHDFFRQLHTTLNFAAFPDESGGGLKYLASNTVGDAVILYSLVLGPMWDTVLGASK
jgi:hypothetical protein